MSGSKHGRRHHGKKTGCYPSWRSAKPFLLCLLLSKVAHACLLMAIIVLFCILLFGHPMRALVLVLFFLCVAMAGLLC